MDERYHNPGPASSSDLALKSRTGVLTTFEWEVGSIGPNDETLLTISLFTPYVYPIDGLLSESVEQIERCSKYGKLSATFRRVHCKDGLTTIAEILLECEDSPLRRNPSRDQSQTIGLPPLE